VGDTIKIRKPDFSKRLEKPSGRVVHDDRGAAVWHWSKDGHESALNLNPAALTLVDDSPAPAAAAAPTVVPVLADTDWSRMTVETGAAPERRPHAVATPYSPARHDRDAGPRKPRDLRALSKWIELQRRMKADSEKGDGE
jgi:hypothetical protein